MIFKIVSFILDTQIMKFRQKCERYHWCSQMLFHLLAIVHSDQIDFVYMLRIFALYLSIDHCALAFSQSHISTVLFEHLHFQLLQVEHGMCFAMFERIQSSQIVVDENYSEIDDVANWKILLTNCRFVLQNLTNVTNMGESNHRPKMNAMFQV